jgi:hypothetical protein
MHNGTYFAVRELKGYCDDVGIRQDLAFVAHPHYNGKVKRANGIIFSGLKHRLEDHCVALHELWWMSF